MQIPRATLDQWRALQAIVDYGGFAQAAAHVYRSQSTLSYLVNKLQKQLGIKLLEVNGRKAELTQAGVVLLQRSRNLIKEAMELEGLATSLSQGREAEVRLVVDAAFPTAMLMTALKQFEPLSEGTRVQLMEVVLSGAEEALQAGLADLVITGQVPSDYLGNLLTEVEFVCVANPDHALHKLNRRLKVADISKHLQVVIRDSGVNHSTDIGWLGAEHRWTVTSLETAIEAIRSGLGFAWLPRHQVESKLLRGELKELALSEGSSYQADLFLIFGKPHNVGPATQQLADLIRKAVSISHINPGSIYDRQGA